MSRWTDTMCRSLSWLIRMICARRPTLHWPAGGSLASSYATRLMHSLLMTECLQDYFERCRKLSATRVVQVIAGKLRAPVRQDPH